MNYASGTACMVLVGLMAGCSANPGGAAGPVTALTGKDDDSAADAVPKMAYEAREEDFTDDHPELPGFPMSFNTLLLVFTLDTTVGEANAVLTEIKAEVVGGLPGVAGQVEGILALRVPTTSLDEMNSLIENLGQNERVKYAVQDTLLGTQTVPGSNGGTPADWTWEVTPTGGNWGLELLQVPAMWNLNQFVARSGGPTATGIIDQGFRLHDDVTFANLTSNSGLGDHGTRVAGIMGGRFDNGKGVDGVNPFSQLFVASLGNFGFSASAGQAMITGVTQLMDEHPEILVVNLSLGYEWLQFGGYDAEGVLKFPWKATANLQGGIAETLMNNLAVGGRAPVIVVSAGNDTGKDARYNSPFTNAALARSVGNIIIVESVGQSDTSPGGATRELKSNINGHVSAPGVEIRTTGYSPPSTLPYVYESGTSFAAPHVAGLIGYLYAADPFLPRPKREPDENGVQRWENKVLELLQKNGVAVAGGAKDRIDAYAAVLSLDEAELPTQQTAPIRHALMNVNDDEDFNELDIEEILSHWVDFGITPDWSRYDLNGDGWTGGPTVSMFDLDRVGSTQYGATSYTSGVTQNGLADPFDETALTDLDILCYYAFSSLNQGSPSNPSGLLAALCGAPVVLSVTFPERVEPGVPTPLSIRAGTTDGSGNVDYSEALQIQINVTGGEVAEPNGFTNAEGAYETTATLAENSSLLELTITASIPGGASVMNMVVARPTSQPVTLNSRSVRLEANAAFAEVGTGGQTIRIPFSGFDPFVNTADAMDGSSRGTATLDSSVTIDPELGFTGATVTATASAVMSGEGVGSEFSILAGTFTSVTLTFSIPAGSFYEYTATGSMSRDGDDKYFVAIYRGPTDFSPPNNTIELNNETGTSATISDTGVLGQGDYGVFLNISANVVLEDTGLTSEGSLDFEITLVPAEEPLTDVGVARIQS